MTSSYKRSLYSSIVRIVANVVMIGAVFLGMYMASRSPMSSMSTFCLWFFGISIPVWMGAFALIRKIRQVYVDEGATYIELPRQGASLVYWRVLEQPQHHLGFASGKARCPPSPPLWAGARSGGGGLAGRPLFL